MLLSVEVGWKLDVGLGGLDVECEEISVLGIHTRSSELSFDQVSFAGDPFYNCTSII